MFQAAWTPELAAWAQMAQQQEQARQRPQFAAQEQEQGHATPPACAPASDTLFEPPAAVPTKQQFWHQRPAPPVWQPVEHEARGTKRENLGQQTFLRPPESKRQRSFKREHIGWGPFDEDGHRFS